MENVLRNFRTRCASLMPHQCDGDGGLLYCVTYEEVAYETTTANFAAEVDHLHDGCIHVDDLDEFKDTGPHDAPGASKVTVSSESVFGSDVGGGGTPAHEASAAANFYAPGQSAPVVEAAAASAAAASMAAAAARALAGATETTHEVRPPFHGLLTSCNAVPSSSTKPRSRNASVERVSTSCAGEGAFWAEADTFPERKSLDDPVHLSPRVWAYVSGESHPKPGRVCTTTCLGRQH